MRPLGRWQDVASALARYFSKDTLDSRDAVLMDFFLGAVFTARQNESVHQRYRLLGDEALALSGPVVTARETLRTPGAEGCWDENRDLAAIWGYSGFVDAVESLERE